MKRLFFSIVFTALFAPVFSQDDGTELRKENILVNVGFLGGWIGYERHLSGLFTLRSEIGFEGAISEGLLYEDTYVGFTPDIRLEPRYYYNFNRRVRSGKNTSYNAANYISLSAIYVPDLFTISKYHDSYFKKGTQFTARWGMKRTVGRRFNFEFAAGPGFYIYETGTEPALGLDLRFGYNIK